jgi:hypothetical protein
MRDGGFGSARLAQVPWLLKPVRLLEEAQTDVLERCA